MMFCNPGLILLEAAHRAVLSSFKVPQGAIDCFLPALPFDGISFLFPGAQAPVQPNSCILSSSIFKSAVATFSSRCSTLEVPGIGNMTGDRASSHARATCDGLACRRAAIRLIGSSHLKAGPRVDHRD